MNKKAVMNDNLSTMVIAIGSIIVALLIVSAIFMVWGRTSTTFDKAAEKIDKQNVTLDESQYTDYDGAVVSGTQVVSFIKVHANDEICVPVNNGHTTTNYIYSSTDLTDKTGVGAIAEAQNKANLSTVYINPNSKYVGKIIRDSVDATNGTIVGMDFTIQP